MARGILSLGSFVCVMAVYHISCCLLSQCAYHFDHLGFLPKIATNHTVNLAKSHTDT